MTFRGTNAIILRIVVVYRPVKTSGATTAYNQQATALQLQGNSSCPRQQLLDDLSVELTTWIEAGERIVLAIDLNDDIRGEESRVFFESFGLSEVLIALHGPGPPTYLHSNDGHAVDGIFCTPNLAANVRGGYFDVGVGIYKADHRCLWIDIPFVTAFGSTVPNFIRPEARRLRCQDPRLVAKYNSKVLSLYRENQPFLDFLQQLEAMDSTQVTPLVVRRYNEFNTWRSEVLLRAEQQCRKLRMGGVPFSPRVTTAMLTIEFWKYALNRRTGGKYSVRYFKRLERDVGVSYHEWGGLSLQDLQAKLSEAYRHYGKVKLDARDHRNSFLEELAMAQAAAGDGNVSAAIKNLRQRELVRETSRKIKFILRGAKGNGSLDHVVGPDGVTASDKEGMFRILAAENTRRFLQTMETPFMSNPDLLRDFGRFGLGEGADAVMRGDYVVPLSCTRGTKLFLEYAQRPPEVVPIPARIPTEYYKQAFKCVDERTGASYSGIHYGHYKALFTHPSTADVEAAWLNAPFRLGFSSARSQKGVDVMLEKKAGVRQVDKLRAILLFEADYNTHAKILSRQIMSSADKWLAREQFGSRKRHSAIAQALNKRLLFDYIRINHHPTCWVFTDAKSCYDRIVHSPASLALQKLGVHPSVLYSLFSTVAKMRHYVRTALGDSSNSYSSGGIPFQGVGQGNGMGPCIWAAVSSVLFDALRGSGFGAKVRSPISEIFLALIGGGLVDDLDLFSMADPHLHTEADVEEMQRGLDLWEELLRASGGAVEPTKSDWYRIDFTWKNGVAKMRTHDPGDSVLTCLDHTQSRRALTLKQVDQGSKTLGVYLAPDGSSTEAIKALRAVADTCADQIRTLRLQVKDIWMAGHLRFLKKLHYPLLAMCLSEKDCTYIMSPLVEAMLLAVGMCRKVPRAIVYGPRSHQGLGMPNLYTTQALTHVEMILSRSNPVTSHMIRTAIELTLLEAGIPGPLFQQPYCPYVTKSWVSTTWKTVRMDLDLEFDDGVVGLPLLCTNDCYLMPRIAGSGRFTNAQLGHINRCRLYLMVYSLADITDGDGIKIAPWAWAGDTMQRHRPRRAIWPYQQRPGTLSWGLWRKALRECFVPSLHMPLEPPLGAWSTNDHHWFYSPSLRKLYSFGHLYTQGTNGMFRYRVPVPNIPADAMPAMVSRTRGRDFKFGGCRPYQPPAVETNWDSLEAYLASRPESLKWAVTNCVGLERETQILAAITQGRCVVVSDGSFQAGFSTAAYTIAGNDDLTLRMDGVCVVPGRDQSAFRAELGGIYAGMQLLFAIVDRANLAFHSVVTVACDGRSALDRLRFATAEAKGSHFDLVSAIVSCKMKLASKGVEVQYEHVRGHQDRLGAHVLSLMESFNVMVDEKAQQFNCACREAGMKPCDGDIFGEVGAIWINVPHQGRLKITHDIIHSTHDIYHAAAIQTHWEEKGAVMDPQAVDWELVKKVNSKRSVAQHLFTVKRVSGYLGVAKWLHRWNQAPSQECLLCGSEKEDISHVYRCPAVDMQATWDYEVNRLSEWVEESTQSTRLSQFIGLLLSAYRETGPPETPQDLGPELRCLWIDQLSIGTDSLLNGFWSSKWRDAVEGSTGTCQSATWLAKLGRNIYDLCGAVWGKRNELVRTANGSRIQLGRQAVLMEITRGSEGNQRVHSLLQDGSRPGEDSSLEYINMWLASVQVARAASLPSVDRDRESRRIMHQWLRGGNSRRAAQEREGF